MRVTMTRMSRITTMMHDDGDNHDDDGDMILKITMTTLKILCATSADLFRTTSNPPSCLLPAACCLLSFRTGK